MQVTYFCSRNFFSLFVTNTMKYLVILLLFFSSSVFAQFELTGRIIDAKTKNPLPFASISTSSSFTIAGLDGTFLLNTVHITDSVSVSYMGYQSEKIYIKKKKR